MNYRTNRRKFLESAALGAVALPLGTWAALGDDKKPLPVAGVVTEYRKNSHADVILGKILEGYDQAGGPGPALKLVSLFTDQVSKADLSRELAEKHGVRIAGTIDEALTLGMDKLQVAGVLSIGEHGDYPFTPDTHQRMYPRRRFFDAIADCFRRVGQVVPVFNDKHLAYAWADAKHIFDRAREQKIPFLAGSSVPVAWRRPPLELRRGCKLESALAVGYGGLEDYGFHALEMLQCMVERRAGGETGVASVRVLQGEEIDAAQQRGEWSQELLAAALGTTPKAAPVDLQKLRKNAAFAQIEYRDGLRATLAMANGIATQFSFAAKLRGEEKPVATWFELEEKRPFGHFAFLVRAIERMIQTGQPPYPVERTLLTTGVLDAIMHGAVDAGKWLATPELAITYQPTDWAYANREEAR